MHKNGTPTEMPMSESKKELQSFLGIFNYLGKYSLAMSEIFESLCKLSAMKSEFTWKKTYQEIYERAKAAIMKDACMTFYD